jgi:formate dehydrogenase
MSENSLTTYETGLAVVANSMKKARLRPDTLIVNSFVGGILFSTGGMLHVLAVAGTLPLYQENPAVVQLFVGVAYATGLFFVVVMGADLFNSNILYFSTGLCRRAVTFLDLVISLTVSLAFNLVGNIFVCGIFCHLSKVASEPDFVEASRKILMAKMSYSFAEVLLKGIAGNFFVCLAVYLQMMVRPLHVKFFMLVLPTLSFVFIGFSHVVADLTIAILGYINDAPVALGTVVWRELLPVTIGNIIGGSFFGIVIVWFLHLFMVEEDQRRLNLPAFSVRDEQPQQNMDSRVVTIIPRKQIEEEEELEEMGFNDIESIPDFGRHRSRDLERTVSGMSRFSTRSRARKSPKNVFPVYGMGQPSERERKIAGHVDSDHESDGSLKDLEKSYTHSIFRNVRRSIGRKHSGVDMGLSRSQDSNTSSFNRYNVNRHEGTASTPLPTTVPTTSADGLAKVTSRTLSDNSISSEVDDRLQSETNTSIDSNELNVEPFSPDSPGL